MAEMSLGSHLCVGVVVNGRTGSQLIPKLCCRGHMFRHARLHQAKAFVTKIILSWLAHNFSFFNLHQIDQHNIKSHWF